MPDLMPLGWSETTLGQFLAFQRGHDLPQRDRREGKVPVIGSGGRVGSHDRAIANGPGITVGRAANLGVPTLVRDDFWPLNTTLYVTDFFGNDVRFCYYLLRTLDLTGFNSGSVQPMLNRNYIKNFRLFVPPKSEQNAIAALLSALDDKIAVNDRITDTSDQLADSVLHQLIASPQVDWRTARLGDVAAINESRTEPSDGYLRYIDISSVSVGKIEWPNRTSWTKAPSRARRHVRHGDIIWSTVRPGRRSHALVLDDDSELVASTGFAVLTPRLIGSALLYGLVTRNEFVGYLESVAEGSAYPAVKPERFLSAEVPVPPEAVARSFESGVMPLRSRTHAAHVENRCLAELRDGLLPKLISGELRIKDAEKTVEDAT